MQQNDILVVTPNKVKAQNSDIGNSTTLWFSATGILVSLASLLATISSFHRANIEHSLHRPTEMNWG